MGKRFRSSGALNVGCTKGTCKKSERLRKAERLKVGIEELKEKIDYAARAGDAGGSAPEPTVEGKVGEDDERSALREW